MDGMGYIQFFKGKNIVLRLWKINHSCMLIYAVPYIVAMGNRVVRLWKITLDKSPSTENYIRLSSACTSYLGAFGCVTTTGPLLTYWSVKLTETTLS